MIYPANVVVVLALIALAWIVRGQVVRAMDRYRRKQTRRINNAINNIRDFSAMREALQCLHTLSYSDACEILERRLNEIRGNDENNGD